jgi:hypothetical protein
MAAAVAADAVSYEKAKRRRTVTMSTAPKATRTLSRARRSGRLAAFVAAVLLLGPPRWSLADASAPRTFPSASDASEALFQAARTGDRDALRAILDGGSDLASCGDESRDGSEREQFVEKYQEMHRLVREPDGTTVLYVGAENWPFPIPLVSSSSRWHFDAEAGRREVMFRRIGTDEATAIEVCRAAGQAATKDATPENSTDPIVSYAERLAAAARTISGPTGRAIPDEEAFHGYRFVVVNSGSISIVAYPAEYRSSGVMTFLVGKDGVVYERDLGPDTARVARTLKVRPPSGWRAVG